MGMVLGLDGKLRAVQINTGAAPSTIAQYYVGLLSTLPADYDGMTLEDLVSLVGTEFTPSGTWYTGGRVAIDFEDPPGVNGATGCYALNTTSAQWTNTSGASVDIEGVFITDVQSGNSGGVYWVGPPDVGTMTVVDGDPVDIFVGGMQVGVD